MLTPTSATSLLSRRLRQWEWLSASALSICSSVCLLPKCKNKCDFVNSKPKQFRAMVSINDLYEVVYEPFKEPIIGSLKSKMADIRHLENRHDVIFFCSGWSDLDKILETGAEWHVDCSDMVEIESRCRIPRWWNGGRLGKFNGMSSQSHVSHCRVLPLGEFTVMIPEPHATLQSAVTWRNQCHDRAT